MSSEFGFQGVGYGERNEQHRSRLMRFVALTISYELAYIEPDRSGAYVRYLLKTFGNNVFLLGLLNLKDSSTS